MNFLEKARNISFWMIDKMRGNEIKNALITLQNCEDGIWTEQQVHHYQEKEIKKLLEYAKKNVPFYKNQKNLDLSCWPIVNKTILKVNGINAISEEYSPENLIHMYTSGSTGIPFDCMQNVRKKRHVNAETIFYNGKIGYSVGKRIIYLRSIVTENEKRRIDQFAQNIHFLDCNDLSDAGIKSNLKKIVKLSKGCGAMLMGYGSTFTAYKQYFVKYGTEEVKNAEIYGIVSGSDMLYDKTREAMENAFKCKCVSRYANEENGFIGQDDSENNVFISNRADYYIEILKFDEDKKADENEIGRIVVTDLYNYGMPMIRYDTGDVGAYIRVEHNNRERLAIGNFGGRIVDTVYDTNRNLVSPHAISNLFWKYQEITQFQFIQKNLMSYDVKVVADENKLRVKELTTELKSTLGDSANINIIFTDNIPTLSSGKRRYIVNES